MIFHGMGKKQSKKKVKKGRETLDHRIPSYTLVCYSITTIQVKSVFQNNT